MFYTIYVGSFLQRNMVWKGCCFWLLQKLCQRALFSGVKFLGKGSDPETWQLWIKVLSNTRDMLETKKTIWICWKRFNCPFVTIYWGKQPSGLLAIFEEVTKSCLKQSTTKPCTTKSKISDNREKKQEESQRREDSMPNFIVFCPSFQ